MGFLQIGMKLLPYIVEAVNWVEKFIKRKGQAKQDAAIQMVLSMLGIAESAKDKDLLNDSDVETATRKVIDAVVALQNVISKKTE
tara:strand:+ start:57 stop:311 length:255 start_codon:yes stop_codon:yes gene_type:complete